MGTPASPARGITSWFKGKQINGKEGGRGYTPIKHNEIYSQNKTGYMSLQQDITAEIDICNVEKRLVCQS